MGGTLRLVFTGIVEEVGRLREAAKTGTGSRLVFEASVVLSGTKIGDSIAVNGCCLTVVELGKNYWAAEAVAETLARTNLGFLTAGDPVNLERPVRPEDRLGGHLVQGHVDALGTVRSAPPDLAVEVPRHLRRYLVVKGSVAVEGCSLTVAAVSTDGFRVAIIPHTASATTLGLKQPGDRVNLEADVIAKYVEGLLIYGDAAAEARR